MKAWGHGVLCAVFLTGTAALAQDVAINRDNRTIAVVATETVRVNPDSAVVSVGYQNSAETKDAAYAENVRTANRILGVLLQAGLAKEDIQSSKLSLGYEVEKFVQQEPRRVLYVAHQSWTIRVAAADAQKVVESAVKAGANEVDDVEWSVADAAALENKAVAAAMAKARKQASELAASTGQKVGALLYLSNSSDSEERFIAGYWAKRSIDLSVSELQLFPKMVEQKATVRAVFALE